jgi:hypothetical protein
MDDTKKTPLFHDSRDEPNGAQIQARLKQQRREQ